MKLSTKGRYAIIALVDLAIAKGDDLTSLAEISGRQDISLPYLEQLFVRLRRAGLVDSVRGPGGGYRLARLPEQIRADVVERDALILAVGGDATFGTRQRIDRREADEIADDGAHCRAAPPPRWQERA